MIWLVESPRSEDHIFAHMKLHHSPADGFIRSMTVENVKYGVNQGYQRGHGYWRPNVRKHGFFNVTSFEKLNLDRDLGMTRPSLGLFWYILAPKRMVQ